MLSLGGSSYEELQSPSQAVLLPGRTVFNLMVRCLLPSFFSHSFAWCLSSVFALI